jgi:pimeloyl-ACP methyl ester carboxylesterase
VDNILTRYRTGPKGPVLVVHGASVSSSMFTRPMLKQNFLGYLAEHGYDVWLLDWRASIQLPLTQFTLDQAARNDYPTAIRFVLENSGADSIQAVVHCVGSITFFQALAAGLLPEVRCVVSSQVALHYDVPAVTEIKCMLNLPTLLQHIGLDHVAPDTAPEHPLFPRLLGELVDVVHHDCSSTVCHRLTFMFGKLYRHNNLSVETHQRLNEFFGACNLTTFRHLSQLAVTGQSAAFDYGEEENLKRYGQPHPPSFLRPEHLRIPITFVSGELNRTFLPASTEATFNWLRQVNEPHLYSRRIIPAYGHIDGFVGSDASRDAYPIFLEQLEACPA